MLAAIHLTAAHWPYFHAETPLGLQNEITRWLQSRVPRGTADGRPHVRGVLEVLRSKGILDNALVVVLSDHGEALGIPSESLLNVDWMVGWPDSCASRGPELGPRPKRAEPGSVPGAAWLSRLRFARANRYPGTGSAAVGKPRGRRADRDGLARRRSARVSTESRLHRRFGQRRATAASSNSGSDSRRPTFASRRPITENSRRRMPHDKQLDYSRSIERRAGSTCDRTMIEPLLTKKERAALDETRLLAAIPVAPDRHQYLLVDRQSGQGRVLAGRPDSTDPRRAATLGRAARNFAGELKSPVVVTPEVQQQLAHQWAEHPAWNQGVEPLKGMRSEWAFTLMVGGVCLIVLVGIVIAIVAAWSSTPVRLSGCPCSAPL